MTETVKIGDIVNVPRRKIKLGDPHWDVVPCEVQIYVYDVGNRFYYLEPMLHNYEAGIVNRNSLNSNINNPHSKTSVRLRI